MKKKKKLKVKYALDVDVLYSGTWRPGSLVDEHGRSYFPIGHFRNTNHETNIGWVLEIPSEVFGDFPNVTKAKLVLDIILFFSFRFFNHKNSLQGHVCELSNNQFCNFCKMIFRF